MDMTQTHSSHSFSGHLTQVFYTLQGVSGYVTEETEAGYLDEVTKSTTVTVCVCLHFAL